MPENYSEDSSTSFSITPSTAPSRRPSTTLRDESSPSIPLPLSVEQTAQIISTLSHEISRRTEKSAENSISLPCDVPMTVQQTPVVPSISNNPLLTLLQAGQATAPSLPVPQPQLSGSSATTPQSQYLASLSAMFPLLSPPKHLPSSTFPVQSMPMSGFPLVYPLGNFIEAAPTVQKLDSK